MHLEEAHRSMWEEVKSQKPPPGKEESANGGTPEDLPNVGKFVESLEDIFQAKIGSKLVGKEVGMEYLRRKG